MQTIIYIDTLFLVNFYMDYMVLWLTTRIMKTNSDHLFLRRILAAVFGALVMCIIVFFHMTAIGYKILACVLGAGIMTIIVEEKKSFVRIKKFVGIMFFLTFTLGGALNGLFYYTVFGYFVLKFSSTFVLVLGVLILGPVLSRAIRKIEKRLNKNREIGRAELINHGKKVYLTALIDTGNSLRDPFFDKAVSVASAVKIEEIMDDENSYHLIPYRAIGCEHGLIPVVKIERMKFIVGDKKYEIVEPYIAIYSNKVSSQGEYDMILNPELLKRSENDDVFKGYDA